MESQEKSKTGRKSTETSTEKFSSFYLLRNSVLSSTKSIRYSIAHKQNGQMMLTYLQNIVSAIYIHTENASDSWKITLKGSLEKLSWTGKGIVCNSTENRFPCRILQEILTEIKKYWISGHNLLQNINARTILK